MADIVATRISQLRGLTGLSKTDLAERLDVSPSAVSQWEAGTKQPGLEKVLPLSQALGVSPVLLQKAPPEWPRAITGAVSFRATKAARTRAARERARSLAMLSAEVFAELSRHVKLPALSLPELPPTSSAAPDVLAAETRRAWGLGERPILRLGELLESKGILLAEVRFGDARFDAFSCIVDGLALIFLGSDKGDRARRRFDAAHELAHLVLHQHLTQEDFDDASTLKRVEDEANSFAAAFLLPATTFIEDLRALGSVTLAGLLRLKSRWGVSAQAMVRRARDLTYISQETYEQLCHAIAMRRWRGARQEPGDDMVPPLVPTLGQRAVQLLADAGILQRWQLLEQLPMPRPVWEAVANFDPADARPSELENVVPFPRLNDMN